MYVYCRTPHAFNKLFSTQYTTHTTHTHAHTIEHIYTTALTHHRTIISQHTPTTQHLQTTHKNAGVLTHHITTTHTQTLQIPLHHSTSIAHTHHSNYQPNTTVSQHTHHSILYIVHTRAYILHSSYKPKQLHTLEQQHLSTRTSAYTQHSTSHLSTTYRITNILPHHTPKNSLWIQPAYMSCRSTTQHNILPPHNLQSA
jgi:hypothetical protein